MIDQVFNRLSRLVFAVTFFTISISFAGLMYVDELSHKLGFNISLFDLNFYDFFIYVVIADNLHMLAGFVIFFAVAISFILYPKSLIFIFDFLCICFISIWFFLGGSDRIIPFMLVFLFPLFIPLILIILLVYSTLLKLKDFEVFEKHLFKVKTKLNSNDQYMKSFNRVGEGSQNFFKSYIVFSILLIFFLAWLAWIVYIGKQGTVHAQKYLDSNEYKTISFNNNSKIQAVMVSKVKNGYIFVLKEENKNKERASFIPDNVIYRID